MNPLALAGIGALGSAAGGLLSGFGNRRKEPKETKLEKQKQQLLDQLLASVTGQGGPFSNLFDADENIFQRSIVDPARQRFRTQTAPQIQQQFIASGQQRSSGLEDQLTRAGVDLDQMLNQQLLQFQQGAQQRQLGGIQAILGQQGRAPREREASDFQNIASGFGGFLSGTGFTDIFKKQPNLDFQPRKGFEQ